MIILILLPIKYVLDFVYIAQNSLNREGLRNIDENSGHYNTMGFQGRILSLQNKVLTKLPLPYLLKPAVPVFLVTLHPSYPPSPCHTHKHTRYGMAGVCPRGYERRIG